MKEGVYKVLHLVSSGGLYGAERVILNLSKELKGSPFVPIVGVIHKKGAPIPEILEAATALGIDTLLVSLRSRFDPFGPWLLGRKLKEAGIHMVHSHGYKATLLAFLPSRWMRIPLVVTCHLWFNKGNVKLRLYHEAEALVMKFLPAVVGVSEEICKEIKRKSIQPERVKLIHNGISLDHYQIPSKEVCTTLKEEFGIGDSDFVIGTAGRLNWQKAHHHLLEAVKRLRDGGVPVKCLIVGDGPLKKQLEEARDRLGLGDKVFFIGYRNDILDILDILDVFVLTSVDEGLPMVLLEAMALRKAIISTPVGAIESIIRHGVNGLLFDVGDVQVLTEHISNLKDDEARRKNLGREGQKTFNNEYKSSIMARKYIGLYRAILENK